MLIIRREVSVDRLSAPAPEGSSKVDLPALYSSWLWFRESMSARVAV